MIGVSAHTLATLPPQYSFFYITMGLRFSATSQEAFALAKVFYSVNTVQLFLRVLRLYAVNRDLGPKLLILAAMMTDMFVFLMLFLVFMFAYGVSTAALLYPNAQLPWRTAVNAIVYRPYFQVGRCCRYLHKRATANAHQGPRPRCLSHRADIRRAVLG